MRRQRIQAAIAFALLLLALASCSVGGQDRSGPGAGGRNASQSSAAVSATKSPGTPSEKDISMQIFDEQCSQCHSIGASGKKDGIPLDHEGTSRTQAWIEAKIRHPERTNPRTGMPLFPPDRISDKELRLLGHYLKSLK